MGLAPRRGIYILAVEIAKEVNEIECDAYL